MRTQRRFWWQKIKQDRVAIGVIAIVLIGVLAFIFAGYWFHWSWTGFLNKALWDWLQLLIIPVVLATGGVWFNQIQKSREQRTTEQQAALERELIRDNQQETLLQAYIDKMSELLLSTIILLSRHSTRSLSRYHPAEVLCLYLNASKLNLRNPIEKRCS